LTPQKRLGLIVAVAALIAVAWPSTSEAQIWYPPPYPPAYRYAVDPGAAVRLDVTPKEAEVYVDGYYAGIVDDFNGFFQRLRTSPGQHDITLYRDGYRSVTQHVYLTPDATFKITYRMEKLAPGEVAEARPLPPNPPPIAQNAPPVQPRGPIGRRPGLPPPPRNLPPPPAPPQGPPGPPSGQAGSGTISIRVQPADAEVLIDGQPWRLAAGQDRTTIDASEGRHNIQVHKEGYVGFLTDVEVRPGETTPLEITLRRQP
jgi:hypothetical protein